MNISNAIPAEILKGIDALPHTAQQKEHAKYILRNSPSRVSTAKTSQRWRYHSRKTGRTEYLEGSAWMCAYMFDANPEVLFWVAEPPSLSLKRPPTHPQANTPKKYTPDFFVIEKSRAYYVESKTRDSLEKLAETESWRYTRNLLGDYTSPAAERATCDQGFGFSIIYDFNYTLVRNLQALAPLAIERSDQTQAIDCSIAEYVRRHEGEHIDGIKLALKIKGADVRAAVAAGVIWVDLENVDIANSTDIRLFSSSEMAALSLQIERARAKEEPLGISVLPDFMGGEVISLDFEIFTILLIHGDSVVLRGKNDNKETSVKRRYLEQLAGQGRVSKVSDSDAAACEAFKKLSGNMTHLKIAQRRYEAIKSFLEQQPESGARPRYKGVRPNRTQQRWIEKYKDAKLACGIGLVGLIPQVERRGPRRTLLNAEKELAIAAFVLKCHGHPDNTSVSLTYGAYLSYLDEAGLKHLRASRRTFEDRIRAARKKTEPERKGDAGRAETEPPYTCIEYTTPRHGDYPYQFVHIDHSPLDIETIDPRTGRVLGKPWITLMFDAATRAVLAFYISYHPPGYSSVYAVMRLYMKRHRHRPVVLVTDNGADFASDSMELMERALDINCRFRRVRRPNDGSIIERMFGTTERQLIDNMRGSDKLKKQGIFLDSEHTPANRACFSLEQLDIILSEYFYDWYANQTHPALLCTPQQAFSRGMAEFGDRVRTLPDTRITRILLAPIPKRSRGLVKVQPKVGVQVGYFRYWNRILDDAQHEGRFYPVRYDPLVKTIVYVWIRGMWRTCHCRELEKLMTQTGRSMQCLSAGISLMRSEHGKSYDERCADLARFLEKHAATDDFCIEAAKRELTACLLESKIRDGISADVTDDDIRETTRCAPPPVVNESSLPVRPGVGDGKGTEDDAPELAEPTPPNVTFDRAEGDQDTDFKA